MMNKIIAAAVMATVGLSATSANAKVFNGFAVGANAGVLLAHSKVKTAKNVKSYSGKPIIGSDSSTDNLGMFGIQFQYACSQANSFYWGAGLDTALYSGKNTTKMQHKESWARRGRLYERTTTATTSSRYLFSNQLDARLGWNFQDKTIVYGLVGLKFQKVKYSVRIDSETKGVKKFDPLKFKKTNTKPVFVLGAGTAIKISDKVSMGAEYRYSFEKNYTLIHNKKPFLHQKNSSHAVLANVSYHF